MKKKNNNIIQLSLKKFQEIDRKKLMIGAGFVFIIFIIIFINIITAPKKIEYFKIAEIPDTEFDPEAWGKIYPLQYESWLSTKVPKPRGMSKYKKGSDKGGIIYDKLSEYPFLALLYNGWAFGIEYNEPRGHYYSIIDQTMVDPSRVSAGGVCLACKSPYHKSYTNKFGLKYLKAKFLDAVNMLPEKTRFLGASCIDCHVPSTMDLRMNKNHAEKSLALLGKKNASRQEGRSLACAQCHITYIVPRDENGKVAGDVIQPWAYGKWGNISIEGIIKDLLTDYKRLEWTQSVTGYKMPFIRHPEFEMFSNRSVHWSAGVACADCHMPYKRTGSYKISDHDITSPLKKELKSCGQCHTESASWLKDQVLAIQDRTVSMIIKAGYSAAINAKLIQLVHNEQKRGKKMNSALYERAKKLYIESFLRLVFVGAENSTGFHNPTEAMRILGDSMAGSAKSEALLRQALALAGVNVPINLNLELEKYLKNRGEKKLMFNAGQEITDPFKQ